jgi:DNA-binding transcriptional MerR regulator
MAAKKLLRIGELASKSGVTPRTIRFYVQEKLLPQPLKSSKTLALYGEDCVDKIRAIKKAQSQRFLPLVVIRRILEKHDFDYAALSHSHPMIDSEQDTGIKALPVERSKKISLKKMCAEFAIPEEILKEMVRLKWIRRENENGVDTLNPAEAEFLKQFSRLSKSGVEYKDALNHYKAMKSIVEKGVDAEFRSAIGWVMKTPGIEFDRVLAIEEQVSRIFINVIRAARIKNIVHEYKITADNAYRASADEGFAVPEEEIVDDIRSLQRSLNKSYPDVRVLSDIALGYSCIGHLDQSLKYLRRVLKIDPHNADAQVRLVWYRRFAKRKREQLKLRAQLEEIIRENRNYALGHAFLATWYALEITEIDDHNEILRQINLCLHELDLAEREKPHDLHEWVIIQYAKGRIPFWVPISLDYKKRNIKAFGEILKQKNEINEYYNRRMPFFLKWLWPNVYYFYGISLMELGKFKAAEKILVYGRNFNAVAPYHARLEEAIQKSRGSARQPERLAKDEL